MAKEITALAPAIPPTTAIQDPAVRNFANAVADALRAMQSAEASVQALTKAFDALAAGGQGAGTVANGGEGYGVPQHVVSSILRSQLYASLRRAIERVDIARYRTLQTGLTAEQEARQTADESLTTELDAAVSRIGASEAAIVSEATTRANNDTAVLQAVNTAWAFTGATQALIQSGSAIQTNWTAAQANRWTQLESEVFTSGGKTIRQALSEEMTLRSNSDGTLFAQYTVKVDQNGYVSGFGFASTANNGTPSSQFIVLANRFAVVTPGGAAMVPFVVEGTTTYINNANIKKGNVLDLSVGNTIRSDNYVYGSSGWTINRDGGAEFRSVIVRGDVQATSLQAGSAMVGTLHIQGEAVTVPAAAITDAFVDVGTANTTLQSAYIDPGGGNAVAWFSCSVRYATNIGTGITLILELTNPAGSVLQTKQFTLNGTGASAQHDVVLMARQLNMAGTYSARARVVRSAGQETASAEYRNMLLLGCKR